MNPTPATADEILKLVDRLPPEERKRLLQRLRERAEAPLDPSVEASFEEARRITAKLQGSLADAIVAERADRDL